MDLQNFMIERKIEWYLVGTGTKIQLRKKLQDVDWVRCIQGFPIRYTIQVWIRHRYKRYSEVLILPRWEPTPLIFPSVVTTWTVLIEAISHHTSFVNHNSHSTTKQDFTTSLNKCAYFVNYYSHDMDILPICLLQENRLLFQKNKDMTLNFCQERNPSQWWKFS